MSWGQAARFARVDMTPDIREYYRVLELSPGASLDEIKGAYRRLLNQWHPDRFKPGSVMQTTAEDITKELNEAYHQLGRKKRYLEFRRARSSRPPETTPSRGPWTPPRHRAREAYAQAAKTSGPPPASSAPPPPPRRKPFRPSEPRASTPNETPSQSVPPVAEAAAPRPSRPFHFRRWLGFTLAAALMAGVGFGWRALQDARETVVTPTAGRAPAWATATRTVASPPVQVAEAKSETERHIDAEPPAGRSAAVAEPSFPTGVSTWPATTLPLPNHNVAFAMPTLAPIAPAWTPTTGTRRSRAFADLRGDSTAAVNEALSSLDTFATGDTMSRVLSLQGVPDEANDRVFRYGSSLVYFAAGRVVAWRDGWPRLRIFALPRFVFGGLGTFGLGATRSEVARVQGTPTAVGDSVYFYGNSVVFFDREWVSGWQEIDEPLRARAWPAPVTSLLPSAR